MARHTSLFQTPRSPLIQGRTRWERPLWQAWLGGAAIAAAGGGIWAVLRNLPGHAARLAPVAALYLVGASIVGAGIGVVLARVWGWRNRWIGAAIGGGVLVALTIAFAPLYAGAS